ncbi:MAG: diguanylate cyclase [Gammaproteobacteria bacterium]|nr:diguanylate cyclase [Gammaproteobacteria bacterium]NIM72626.1 diguanylate cyclase [Gammaproteobacteria bacterium]NIN37683.1 diguanylate cyclase [Gammaproteobacteria bacterium]NIO24387.1 diguanylate cyclase [Gammaproteobacteria bacterium]NIO64990.1 diguanylate cyclase [Gammaproteobacteria bacterium]
MLSPSLAIEPGLPEHATRLQLFESVINQTENGVVITEPDGAIVYVNPAFTRITGYSRDHVIGKNMRILQSGRQSKRFYQAMWESLLTRDSWSGTIWNRRKNGECYQEWLTVNAVRNEAQETVVYVGMFSDISSIKSREHQLEQLAYIDPLTELPNQLLFHDRLAQTLAFARRNDQAVSLLVVDVDCIKEVNERYGFLFGDRILQNISRRMQKELCECDCIGRLAEDEFSILLYDTEGGARTVDVCERIRAAIAKPHDEYQPAVTITASIGLARYPEDAHTAEALITNARVGMYAAKGDGGNRIRHYADTRAQLQS